ncbi:MAG: AMP-binding protein [Paludibacteraceae bacterium]|nr:AMP-binding protein [Paludibacteraceae bacterium]
MADGFKTIKEFIDYISETYTTRAAYKFIVDETVESRSYNQLKSDSYSLASFLVNKGYSHNHIAILGETSYEWIVSFFAVVISGNVVIPIDRMLPEKEMLFLFGKGDVDCILHSEDFNRVADHGKESVESVKETISFSSDVFKQGIKTSHVELPQTNPDDMVEILFTSGTTGTSKGVMLSQTNIVHNLKDIIRMDYASNLKSHIVVLSVLPIHHTFELTVDNLGVLGCGATVCINDKLENIVKNLCLFKPNMILIVPAIAEAFYKKIQEAIKDPATQKKLNLGRRLVKMSKALGMDARRKVFKSMLEKFGGELTNIVVGGAALRPEICKCFDEFGINVFQGYGLTECAPLVSANYPGMDRVGSVGQAVKYMDVKIENDEILTKGPGLMLGYYKSQEQTDEVIKDGWFHTGDLGYIDKDGYIFITGRCKSLIILDNGKNIYPEELEEKLLHIDGVKDAFVYGDKGRICALILPFETTNIEKKRAIENEVKKINEILPTYKKITLVTFSNKEFPKTTTLKIKRHELLKTIQNQSADDEVKYVAPNTPTEKQVAEAFEQILAQKVGLHDDFFDMGGDSLSAFELAANLGITAQDIYESPTVEQLAKFIDESSDTVQEENNVDVNALLAEDANVVVENPHKCIFITGATGYLGAHVMREFLKRNLNVIALVRDEARLKKTLERYFPKEYASFKYRVVKGNIEMEHFGIDDDAYAALTKEVDTVVHIAANVHHAGNYAEFERTNVGGTRNAIQLSKDANAVLHHTSTASVCGVGTVPIPQTDKPFDEFVLNIGQKYVQNVYIHSKYKAEEAVLLERANGLRANIYRIGNLTWRKSDGLFQKNAEENGFIGRSRGLFKARLYSPELAEYPMDFTAVDECAEAYAKLVLHNRANNVYQLYNPNAYTIQELASKMFMRFKCIPKDEFATFLKEHIMDKDIAILSFYSSIASKSRNVPLNNDFTTRTLKDLGFKWQKIGFFYLRYFRRFMK